MSEIAVLDRKTLVRHGRRLEYFTIVWNTVEGLIAVATGLIAGSISLVGFGIDSFVEVTSGSVSRLGLTEGAPVWATFKAVEVRLVFPA